MSSQASWPESGVDALARANGSRSDTASDVRGIPVSRDCYEAALQCAKRDRAAFLRSMFMRLFGRDGLSVIPTGSAEPVSVQNGDPCHGATSSTSVRSPPTL